SHTHTHQDLTTLTVEQIDAELRLSQEWLKNHGFSYKTLCFPYGNYDDTVLKYTAKYYDGARKTGGMFNVNPIPTFTLNTRFLENTSTLSDFQSLIDEAVSMNAWLIISTHSWEIYDWGFEELL